MTRQPALWSGRLLMALLCAVTMSCASDSPDVPAPVPSLATDEQALQALDYLVPMYQVDADGRVVKLRLTWRHLPPSALAEIGKLTHLRNFDGYGCSMKDDDLAYLKDLQMLRSAGLGGTAITDNGLTHLEKLGSLQWLWLPKQSVTQDAVDKLKAARPDMNIYLQ